MRIRYIAFSIVFLPVTLFGQNEAGIKQILDRLERLEEQNRELVSEVRALRQELASSKKEADVTGAASTNAPPIEEKVALNEQRIEDHEQEKVGSEHRLPIQLTGMLLFNAYANGASGGEFQYPTSAVPSGNADDGASLRQTILGLKFEGPEIFGGGHINGSVSMDFFGGSGQELDQIMRLRVASLDFDWQDTTFSVSQDKPLLAPRNPTSLAQVGISPLSGAGNLWLWRPQTRVEHRFSFSDRSGVRAQIGIYDTDEYGTGLPEYQTGSYSARPALQGRVEYWRDFGGGRRLEIASGFHTSTTHFAGQAIPSRVVSTDWLFRPVRRVEITGTFFGGENMGVLGGLYQGVTVGTDYTGKAVRGLGGWTQVSLHATDRLTFNVYGGQEDDRNRDLLPGGIAKNQGYAANLIYRLGSNVLTSFEAAQIRTTYLGSGTFLNPHYDIGLGYLF